MTERRSLGVIKRMSMQGGYAFIACPELQGVFGCDVFVHRNQMLNFTEGQEVTFAVLLNKDNKPQAFELQDATNPGMLAIQPWDGSGFTGKGKGGMMDGPKGKGKGKNEEILGRYNGVIMSYNPEKNFGFVACPDLTSQGMPGDVYMHGSH